MGRQSPLEARALRFRCLVEKTALGGVVSRNGRVGVEHHGSGTESTSLLLAHL